MQYWLEDRIRKFPSFYEEINLEENTLQAASDLFFCNVVVNKDDDE